MSKAYKILVDSYLDNNVGISINFLSNKLAIDLRKRLSDLNASKQLILAGTGNNTILKHDRSIRNDAIYWLDKKHKNASENQFFREMDRFVSYLNSTCYTGIIGYEFHFAFYDAGSFYKRHLDQFKDNSHRAFSMIIYLNENWKDGDGGELCVHHEDHSEMISPLNRKSVFFKSSKLEHEVMLSHQPRMSVTGWFKTN